MTRYDIDDGGPPISMQVEIIARVLCKQHNCDPDSLEPGCTPYYDEVVVVDGEIGGEPAFFLWRQFVTRAQEILKALYSFKSAKPTEYQHE